MPFEFRPAVREDVGLLIGFAAPSGAGKTLSAMKLAKGICGDEPFAVIDTEARRSLHYADMFKFDFVDLKPPFTPDAYRDAIIAAETRGYKAIITDSFSHEHAGEGGVLDWQEEELNELVKRAQERGDKRQDWQLRDTYNQLSWQKPKKAHKRMIDKFLQCRAHLIFCLRAEDKIEFKKDEKGKTTVTAKETLSGFKGWIPICDKRFPFELTASFILLPDKPGVPQPIKLQEQHRPFFDLDKPITEECGRRLAEWARGKSPATSTTSQPSEHGIAEADIPKCDLCNVPLVYRPAKKMFACANWQKHRDTVVTVTLDDLRKRIAESADQCESVGSQLL